MTTKIKNLFQVVLCITGLFFFTCTRHQEQEHPATFAPKVVAATGYIVPNDSITPPKVVLVDEHKLKKVKAGTPKVLPTNTNVHPVGKPKIVVAGTLRVCIPGQDTFLLPKTVPAIERPFAAGIPEVVIAKDAFFKDQNPASFSSFSKLQGLKHGYVSCMLQDKNGNIWFGTAGGGVSKYDGKFFTHFTEKEGLSNNFIYSILEDKSGNIWFGTFGGGVSRLSRDGKSFTHFTEAQGLSNNIVYSILEDNSGNIWFGTNNGGASRLNRDGKSFTHFTEKEGLSNNFVLSILEDKSGNIWFGTAGGGVSRLSRDGTSFTHFTEAQGLSNNLVLSIMEDKSGNIWFGTFRGGVSRLSRDGKSFTHFTEKEGLSNNEVRSILEDKNGNIWFGTFGGGVSRLSRDGTSFTHFTEAQGLSNNLVLSILEDKNGNIWFGTFGGGVSRLSRDGISFTHFTEKEGLSDKDVVSILEDKIGNIWFGTFRGGVSQLSRGTSFTHFTEAQGLSNNDIVSILEDKIGNIWFSTEGAGVSRLSRDGTFFTHFTEAQGLPNNNVQSILEDKSGNIWFGTYGGGVSKYDGKSFTHFTEKEGLSNNDVVSILEDKIGNIWFGIEGGGVSKYDGKSFTHFTEKEGLSNNNVHSILEDKSGNIWFSTFGDGVCRLSRDGKSFTHFTEKGGLSNNSVLSFMEDKSGNIWFATAGGGVSKYNGTSFTHFTEAQGLSNNYVLSILEDKSGNLWFGTRFGLNMLSKRKLAEFTQKVKAGQLKASDVLFKNYTYEDGFLGIGCNGNALWEAKDGTIWIGANDRLTAIRPEGGGQDTLAPNIQLTGISLFNENIAWTSLSSSALQSPSAKKQGSRNNFFAKDTTITLGNGVKVGNFKFEGLSPWYNLPENLSLAYNNNYVTFNFIGITMAQPKKVKYQYKLEGIDENWSALTSRNEAPYGNLPPNNYTFKVKAMNSEGVWSDEFRYTFTIRPPWWQTWWAYCLYALLIGGSIGWYVQSRSKALRREKSILEKKVALRTVQLEQKSTELEQSLESLKSTQAQLIQSEKLASLGELTAGIAHEIQNPLNFVNNFAEVSAEMLDEMHEELEKGDTTEAIAIATDLKTNLEKINHHGQRASSIVKGMLEHSRASTGVKEPTDLNALADEYLRLAYHGLRAKDNNFNATMETHFDPDLPLVSIIPQDIGRVLLNLINNAFYAVNQRATIVGAPLAGAQPYVPTVTVSTKKLETAIEIRVQDNGNGIPDSIRDKIFQPFFTTKPTGQGTGLGLSLAYDIVTKGHGGTLEVESSTEMGTGLNIKLPFKTSSS